MDIWLRMLLRDISREGDGNQVERDRVQEDLEKVWITAAR